ncbi:MAG: chromosomal replication initiator protein DnaA [Candidatus Portnoybacteria bacterium]|nr:chromosomal replication initiator protein DnaA [Candidatus Portnoybacteria bacterium]
MTNHELWQAALGEIELNISKTNFITWFRNTDVIKTREGAATVGVPNAFSKEWLENKYNKLILRALRNILPEVKEVEFVIAAISLPELATPGRSTPPRRKETEIVNQSFQELEINKETHLNPKYTFDNFIVGSFNELAQAAAQAITKNLGRLYNPLFIYGGVGLGKTHLIQAIGNEIVKNFKNEKKICYTSSEKFTNELVAALYNGQMEEFKNSYRKIDVLIIDDVQFLSGKEKTQEEFFHTFNALYQNNKQIIISSDRPPKAISTLEERLKSRFEGGMIADISYPDLESRIAILKAKCYEKNLQISDEVLNYIAANIQKNIRELEGALNRVMITLKLSGSLPSLEQISKILTGITSPPSKKISYKVILQAVSEFYDINTSHLINRCRKKELVWPRQVAMFLIREELKSSFPFIGEKLGGRDHTTVMYACEKLNRELQKNESLQQEINLIKERFYSI